MANDGNALDLTSDVGLAASLGTSVERVDELLGEAIDTLGKLVPFDLATVMERQGDELVVRLARGALAKPEVFDHRLQLADFPAIRRLLDDNHARAFTADDHRDGDGDAFDGVLDLPHGHACMVVPLSFDDKQLGIMTFDRQVCEIYSPPVVELADTLGKLLAMALSYGQQSMVLARVREQLREQNRALTEKVGGRTDACRLMEASRSMKMVRVVYAARQVAQTDTPVLITGETGTGKEVMANAIHGWSARATRPMISINCAALPPNLIESELFGHVKGAFSGATKNRLGRFAAANGGTLLLDEIGELPSDLQAKLLRVLQEGCFEPVGSDRTVRVDVRIIAATNIDLLAAVGARTFREDLYYRLAVFPIHLPPLRERREDIPVIAESFLALHARRTGRGAWELDESGRRWLAEQEWRGNVRELTNVLERATILSPGPRLDLDVGGMVAAPPRPVAATAPAATAPVPAGEVTSLEEMERLHIERALVATDGKLYGSGGAAELLGINPNTLRSRMKKLGLGGARNFRQRRS